MATEDEIKKQFPNLYALYRNIPDVWAVLMWAAATKMGPEQIQAAIQNTPYYRTHNEKERAWDATAALDPAQSERLLREAYDSVNKNAIRLGLTLNDAQLQWFGRQAAVFGWDAQELRDAMVAHAAKIPEAERKPGEFGAAMTAVRKLAGEYALPINDDDVVYKASLMLMGGAGSREDALTEDALRDQFAKQAASLFPSLRDELERGVTIKQWAEPYVALAAKELEINPETIDLGNPMWRKVLEGSRQMEGTKATFTPLTLSEWQQHIRTNPQYGFDKTLGARERAADLETELLSRFGAI